MLLTPTELQTHVRRSRFGTGPNHYANYAEEYEGLEKLLKPA